ncbi:replication-associated recombination protein A [Armatimonas sp.]|uniref:replication-associated recombination protein A n=1 Tax=Armatimonas sp. TaxID=1872638 RepID=UPI00374CCFA5
MDLFSPVITVSEALSPHSREAALRQDAPLAARMRPRLLDELAGQTHLLAAGKSLRQAIERDELRSAIFWGPPGCGKSTLASLIARTTRCHFESFSAVTGGVAEVRKLIEAARERRKAYGQRTLLFVDEIHRFNKAQQDAFLPHVEDGTVILIGATTENPYFSVNAPLLSRARLYPFQALSEDDLAALLTRALTDAENGLGARELVLEPQALGFLAAAASGDARLALGALELAAALAQSGVITLADAEEAVGQRSIGYDKSGDTHYDMASALIKSIRGSDPDAAIYYLTRMLEAGEEPRFLARRLVILASEDIGCADPSALPLAMAGFQAVEAIGMPECALNLAHVTLYLAAAPKSNACTKALGRARDDIRNAAFSGIPKPLRDSHAKGVQALGHGVGYLSPHDYPEGFVRQRYLPEGLPEKKEPYYQPTENGVEAKIKARLERLWSDEINEVR